MKYYECGKNSDGISSLYCKPLAIDKTFTFLPSNFCLYSIKPSGLKKFCATRKISRVLDVKPSNKVCVIFRAVILTYLKGIKKKTRKVKF